MTDIVIHDWQSQGISQRADNGYVNLTEMAQAAGKKVNDWLRLKSTKEFLEGYSAVTGIPVTVKNQGFQGLICIFQGGLDQEFQGTWGHPEIAIDFAQWVSVPFRIWANRTLREVVEKGIYVEQSRFSEEEYQKIQGIIAERDERILQLTAANAQLEQELTRSHRTINAQDKLFDSCMWWDLYDRFVDRGSAYFARRKPSFIRWVSENYGIDITPDGASYSQRRPDGYYYDIDKRKAFPMIVIKWLKTVHHFREDHNFIKGLRETFDYWSGAPDQP